jgi:photosystem II stability/assembly factor-like uncharacterized protein
MRCPELDDCFGQILVRVICDCGVSRERPGSTPGSSETESSEVIRSRAARELIPISKTFGSVVRLELCSAYAKLELFVVADRVRLTARLRGSVLTEMTFVPSRGQLRCRLLIAELAVMMFISGFRAVAEASSTGDAGDWRSLPTEPYLGKRDDLIFIDQHVGFYGTGEGQLYRTDDGGLTWQLAWKHEGTFIRSLGFIDRQIGFIGNLGAGLGTVTDVHPLYRTVDGGASWQPVESVTGRIRGICAIDVLVRRYIYAGKMSQRTLIHAAGRVSGPAQLLRSENGGETWTSIDLSDRAGMILDVKFLDPDVGLLFAGTGSDVAQSHALILRTTDGARTWQQVYRSARAGEIIWKASFPTSRIGYATIQRYDIKMSQQLIAKTLDGGRHWTEMPLIRDIGALEFGVGFVDERHGWVGTAIGGFETQDGGKTWRGSALAPMANRIRTATVSGEPLVYAIGSQAQQYRRAEDSYPR